MARRLDPARAAGAALTERPALRLTSVRAVVGALVGLTLLSVLLRVALATRVHAPMVFNDELGYTKLAQSIGLDGRLALFDREGFSYSPLYPALLAPIYALGASAPTAYELIKIVNAFLLSLSIFPLYKIARFALPRPHAVLAAGLSVFAPLMSYAGFTMSENLAYPLCLFALWGMLAAIHRPGVRGDAIMLAAILFATAARIQLVVLLPVALTAVLLAAAAGKEQGPGNRLLRAVRAHRLLFGVTAFALLVAGIRAVAGGDVYSVFGRYANVGRVGLPDPWRVLELGFHHVAGLDLAVGVIPFAGALVVGFAFVRAGFPRHRLPFAAVAVSFTAWLVLQVAVDAALFDGPGLDRPRIHERFMIYAIPLFLVALLAAVHGAQARVSGRVQLLAAAIAGVLPGLIPFDTYVNNTNGFETFALLPFGRSAGDDLVPVGLAPVLALWVAATLALVYVRVLRRSVRGVAVVVVTVFTLVSASVWSQLDASSAFTRSLLPAHADWVDRERPAGDVVLVTGAPEDSVPALETAFHNLTIARAYALCEKGTFGTEFGERRVGFGDPAPTVRASYAIVPDRLEVQGQIVARNPQGGQVLVALPDGRLRLAPGAHAEDCAAG